MQPLTLRPYHTEDDYWRIRAFLRAVYLLNDRQPISWEVARLDYWRWHVIDNCEACDPVADVTFLWETDDGRLAAVLTPEGRGEAFCHVHPAWRSAELEAALLDTAEEHLAITNDDGQRELYVWATDHDPERVALLEARGYEEKVLDRKRVRALEEPIPDGPVPAGYTVRALGGEDELPARSWVSWRAFHPDDPDDAYSGWEWYRNIQRQPLYRRDLDIVAVAPDGAHAAFCTLWYDDVTRSGYFEPVGTDPDHQRRGLAKAVMVEAMRRIKRMGATQVSVGGMNDAANALYASVMQPDYLALRAWRRVW